MILLILNRNALTDALHAGSLTQYHSPTHCHGICCACDLNTARIQQPSTAKINIKFNFGSEIDAAVDISGARQHEAVTVMSRATTIVYVPFCLPCLRYFCFHFFLLWFRRASNWKTKPERFNGNDFLRSRTSIVSMVGCWGFHSNVPHPNIDDFISNTALGEQTLNIDAITVLFAGIFSSFIGRYPWP